MTADASARLQRLLAVLPLFAEQECVDFREVEERAGVTQDDVVADLTALLAREQEPAAGIETLNGLTIEHDRVSLRSSHFKRPMRITIPELCALELGLAMLGAASPPDDRGPIDRARARIREAIVQMPAAEEQELWRAVEPSGGDGEIVRTIRDAAARSAKVRIAYRGASDSQSTERVIHPYAILPSHGTWYVVAHCERSEGLRFFRADRVEQASALDAGFEVPASFTVGELLEDGKPFHGAPAERLVVRYSPHIARWIAERETGVAEPDGSFVVEHPLADDQWAVRHVLQYGPDAEVIAPAAVRDAVRDALARIVASA